MYVTLNDTHMNHQITWVSIPSEDFDRAVAFYTTITGKTFTADGEGDKRMAVSLAEEDWAKGTIGYGITGDSTIKPGATGPRIYLAVEDMDGLLSRVEEAGGKILHPKEAMGDMGFWGLIEDTEGNHIGLHSQS